jgi:glycosyltransferase involved in cell wall biosynthesis
LKVLIAGSSFDGTDVGESFSTYQFVEALSRQADVTLLCLQRQGRKPIAEQLPHAQVIAWDEPAFLRKRFERMNAMLKPALPLALRGMAKWARREIAGGRHFDVAHQLAPQAMRYVTPFKGLPIPNIIGPLGGGLETPEGFKSEVVEGGANRLRKLDGWRLRNDPRLRAGYMGADLIIGVAPYIGDALKGAMPIKRFEVVLERGHNGLEREVERSRETGKLHLVHVGRVIRTKGLRDVIRAMAQLCDLPDVTLTSAGDGPDLEACRAEVAELGLGDRVKFLGKIPREQVDDVFASGDIFCFPSFREPMGGVLFEALSWGLPVVTAAMGGPDYIIDDSCGIRIPVGTSEAFANDIATHIRDLAGDPDRRATLEAGARARLLSFGTWDEKATRMLDLYRDVMAQLQGG